MNSEEYRAFRRGYCESIFRLNNSNPYKVECSPKLHYAWSVGKAKGQEVVVYHKAGLIRGRGSNGIDYGALEEIREAKAGKKPQQWSYSSRIGRSIGWRRGTVY